MVVGLLYVLGGLLNCVYRYPSVGASLFLNFPGLH